MSAIRDAGATLSAIWDAVGSERAAARSCDSSVTTFSNPLSSASSDREGAEVPDEWRSRRRRVSRKLDEQLPSKRAVIDETIEFALCGYNPNFLAAFLAWITVGYGVYAVAIRRNPYGWTEHLQEVRQG